MVVGEDLHYELHCAGSRGLVCCSTGFYLRSTRSRSSYSMNFSVENWKRPRLEVEGLWRLLRYYLRKELPKNDAQRRSTHGHWPH